MIEGVKCKHLKKNTDERGWLMEILRCDDEQFHEFGQVYLTTCYPEVVKGWHHHRLQTDNMCTLKGMAKIVLYDNRDNSSTNGEINEFFVGEHNPQLITIPPGVLHGMKCIGEESAYIINIPDKPYNRENPDEYRIPPHSRDIPYDWSRKDG